MSESIRQHYVWAVSLPYEGPAAIYDTEEMAARHVKEMGGGWYVQRWRVRHEYERTLDR